VGRRRGLTIKAVLLRSKAEPATTALVEQARITVRGGGDQPSMALMFAGVSPAQTGNGNLKALTGRNSSEISGVDAVVAIPGEREENPAVKSEVLEGRF
jgi:hypothetical protein